MSINKKSIKLDIKHIENALKMQKVTAKTETKKAFEARAKRLAELHDSEIEIESNLNPK